ncbi:MAG: TetR/AcrR family transcriptional regulator [Solirubrobacteraceae bacterium]|nr:TetR/AcrR family transcriptional regulator [Solirubrobacteraceae bacterium]
MIDESVTHVPVGMSGTDPSPVALVDPVTPGPREAKRLATRQSILDATVDGLVEDGYGSLTTRRIAERAGIAQSTLMHHFETRESLLVEAVANLAVDLAETALAEIDLDALRGEGHRDAVLDQAWSTFTSPQALAAAQLWGAAWTEPELATALRELEIRVAQLVMQTAATVFPDEATDPLFPVYIDGVVQVLRGLIMAIPTWGRPVIDARWAAIKPVLVTASSHLLAPPS